MTQERAAALFKFGCNAEAAHHFEQAATAFRQVIELVPQHAKALMHLGMVTYASKNGLSEACGYLERSVRIDPDRYNAHMFLGIVLNRLGSLGKSEARFRQALGLGDRPAIVHATFADEFLWRNGRYAEAEHHFKEALALEPDLTPALRDYARMLACHGRDREAQIYFEAATRADPENRSTQRAFNLFIEERSDPTRDPRVHLDAAIARGRPYPGGIEALEALDD